MAKNGRDFRRIFSVELSESYRVALEPVLAVCLAVAGHAAGIAPRLNSGLGADQSGTNLHVMISPGANTSFSYVLSHILAPMRAFQKNRFENYAEKRDHGAEDFNLVLEG